MLMQPKPVTAKMRPVDWFNYAEQLADVLRHKAKHLRTLDIGDFTVTAVFAGATYDVTTDTTGRSVYYRNGQHLRSLDEFKFQLVEDVKRHAADLGLCWPDNSIRTAKVLTEAEVLADPSIEIDENFNPQ